MSREKLIEFLICNEPSFEYNGKEYGVCWPEGKYIAWEIGNEESEQHFETPEDLLSKWIIDGSKFEDIAVEVLKEYFE